MKRICFFVIAILVITGCGKSPVEIVDQIGESLISGYVEEFNGSDEEIYIQKYPNSEAEAFLKENIPVFECPDKELEKTWHFRWWTFRKHIKNTPEGYVITEFLPEVPWAGKYNAICCPAAHHFNEGRWIKDPLYLKDYAAYWCREKGDARRYSFPAAHALLQFYKVHPDMDLIKNSYEDLKQIYAAWEGDHRESPDALFWQGDGYDGGECSISGYLSDDTTGYRATINSYMYADARALSIMAAMLGKTEEAKEYEDKATQIKNLINSKLWDESARFYKVIPRHRDGSFSPAREEQIPRDSRLLSDLRRQSGEPLISRSFTKDMSASGTALAGLSRHPRRSLPWSATSIAMAKAPRPRERISRLFKHIPIAIG